MFIWGYLGFVGILLVWFLLFTDFFEPIRALLSNCLERIIHHWVAEFCLQVQK